MGVHNILSSKANVWKLEYELLGENYHDIKNKAIPN